MSVLNAGNRNLRTYNIRGYFDSKASGYINRSKRMLWNIIKQREKSAILEMILPTSKDSILDAGCGSGYYLSVLTEQGYKAEGIDFSRKMVDEAKRYGLFARVADLEKDIDTHKKYDKVICAGVLEFCNCDIKALVNLKNILKPGGIIVLLVPKLSFAGLLYKMFHQFCGCGERINLYSINKITKISGLCNLKICKIISATSYSLVVKLSGNS